jgi:hypothetical protein
VPKRYTHTGRRTNGSRLVSALDAEIVSRDDKKAHFDEENRVEVLPEALSEKPIVERVKPSTNSVRAVHTEFVDALVERPPWAIPICPDASDIEDRADHLKGIPRDTFTIDAR